MIATYIGIVSLLLVLVSFYLIIKLKSGYKYLLVFVIIIPMTYLLLFWDFIIGKHVFTNLCENKSGYEVTKVVKLRDVDYYSDGFPKFVERKTGKFIMSYFSGKYSYRSFVDREEYKLWGIRVANSEVLENGHVIGRYKSYSHMGGWLSAGMRSGERCQDYVTGYRYHPIIDKVFVME